MIKVITLTVLFGLASSAVFPQNKKIADSLKHELTIAKQDTARDLIMIELCFTYRLFDPDSSLYYGNKAFDMAKRINFPGGEIRALGFSSITLSNIGNLPKSMEYSLRALKIADEHNLQINETPALNGMGMVYQTLKDYPRALSYLHRQLALSLTGGNNLGRAYAEENTGAVFVELNQLDSASWYLKKAAEDFHKIGKVEPILFSAMGDISFKSGNNQAALDYYRKSLQISIKNDEARATSSNYIAIAKLYKKINKPDSGIYYAAKGLADAERQFQKANIIDAATLLSQLYEQKDAKEALKYYKIASAAKDSLYGSGNIEAVQTIANQEKERETELEANKIAYQNQLKEYGFSIGLGILLLIALILYRSNKRERKDKIQLYEKNQLIEKTLVDLKSTQTQLIQSEKMASLGELTAGIAHEIQNPLNFVNNFSEVNQEMLDELDEELNKGDIAEAKAIAADIRQNEEKINHHGKRADGIVKGMLEHSRNGSGQKEPTDINVMADEYMRLSYHGLRSKDKTFNAELITHFDPNLPKIDVIPQDIGRVMLNLFNNAFYAVNQKLKTAATGYKPEVTVTTATENGQVVIKVKDNGVGIPDAIKEMIMQPFFTTKPTGEGTGLGLSLTYDMVVKGHGGSIQVNSSEGEGSEFIIQLPVS